MRSWAADDLAEVDEATEEEPAGEEADDGVEIMHVEQKTSEVIDIELDRPTTTTTLNVAVKMDGPKAYRQFITTTGELLPNREYATTIRPAEPQVVQNLRSK